MLNRRLSLKKETLAALNAEDLAWVGGAADASELTCYTCLVQCDTLTPAISASYLAPTNCCHTVPTFHGAPC